MRKELLLLVIAAVLASPVIAGFVEPCEWQWGEYGCTNGNITKQVWTFDDSLYFPGTALNPVSGVVSPGSPTATLNFNMIDSGWSQGAYYSSNSLGVVLDIPNYDINNPYKYVALVIDYKGEFQYDPELSSNVGEITAILGVDNIQEIADGWNRGILLWEIQPNPTDEQITFTLAPADGSTYTYIDRIAVFTNCCVPEPTTCVLLGLGSLLAIRRKK